MKRYCLCLDLKPDPKLIAEYIEHHRNLWPDLRQHMRDQGILNLELYRWETRLFMIMETREDFDPESAWDRDVANPRVQEWEELMNRYQVRLAEGGKWQSMARIFELNGTET